MRLVTLGFSVGLLMVTQLGCGGGDTATGSGGSGSGGGGGAGGGGGTGGSPSVCEPGKTRNCYDGPAKTEGVGICKAGSQTCKADGSGYGACDGEVLPQPENCATPKDEDCDGKAPACTGDVQWGKSIAGPDSDLLNAMCADPSGSIYVVGEFGSSVTLPNGESVAEAASSQNTLVAKFDGTGKVVWAKAFASPSGQNNVGYACSPLPNGAGVVIAGSFFGAVDFGDGPVSNSLGDQPYVVALNDKGVPIWHRTFMSSGASSTSVAVAADGTIAVGGHFAGTLTVDAGTSFTTQSSAYSDGFLMKLDPKGKPVWARQLRGLNGGDKVVTSIAIDPNGVIAVAGSAYGPADFGSGVASTTAGADQDALIGIFRPTGEQIMLEQFGDASYQSALSIAFAPAGDLVVAGRFSGTLDFGDGTPLVTDESSSDAFAVKLDGKGKVLAKRAFGSPSSNEYARAIVDAAGNVVLYGQYGPSPMMIGTTTLAGGTNRTAYLAKLDNDLNPLWAKGFVASDAWSSAVTVDAQANVFVGGTFNSTQIDFDASHNAMGVAGYDMFLVKLAQ